MKKLLLLIIVISCSSQRGERLTEQSIEAHDEALDISLKTSNQIKWLKNQTLDLSDSVKSLVQDSVQVFIKDLAIWESTIIEIPGHNHDHDHHDHQHGVSPDLTPKMMLEVQRDLRNQILKLNIRVQKLLDLIKKDENESI